MQRRMREKNFANGRLNANRSGSLSIGVIWRLGHSLMLPININSRKSLVRMHTIQRACRARSVSLGVKRGSALFAVKVLSIRAYYLSVRVT